MHIEEIVALLTSERDRLSKAIAALQGPTQNQAGVSTRTSNGAKPSVPVTNSVPKKHGISAAGRRRIAEAAKRRWAAIRAAQGKKKDGEMKSSAPASGLKTAPKKRRLSAAARKAMADAARRRWAAAKAKPSAGARKSAAPKAA